MNPSIFREYDIRGVSGRDLTEAEVHLLGRGVGTYFRQNGIRRVTVGRDCRLTSDAYAETLISALAACGCEVTDIGTCPTPVLYFSIHHLGQEGGVMVTASHNPPEYNGFKLCRGLDSIHGEEIRRIRDLIDRKAFVDGRGGRNRAEVIPAYGRYLAQGVSVLRSLRIGVDAGNGAAGPVAPPILRELGAEVFELYCEMDGRFPHHEADPTVAENLRDLIGLVKERGLEAGIGYDGDGDRIGVVDEKGNIVYGDRLMILFSREILSRKPGATIIGEVKCSMTLYDDIARHGGRALMWKTGHSLIKAKMKSEGAELAGEMSGHLFFADRYLGFDDAIYSSARLLEILSRTPKPLSELLSDVPPTVVTPEIRTDCPDEVKFELVERVSRRLRESHPVIDIDGARVLFDGGWGLIRASNTQPALVLRFEALSEKRLGEIRRVVETELDAAFPGFRSP